jgi:CheY-like chemotaxis protein
LIDFGRVNASLPINALWPATGRLDHGCAQGRARLDAATVLREETLDWPDGAHAPPAGDFSLEPGCGIPFTRNESLPTHLDKVGKKDVMGNSAIKRSVVLIVEDEFLLRMNAAEMIADAGFEVVEAANADEAIAILEVRPDIHVVFTDIQMPGSMDGLKLARFVRGRWPPIKIVATSGFVKVGEQDLPEGSRFLTKPYRPAEIVTTLRELTSSK